MTHNRNLALAIASMGPLGITGAANAALWTGGTLTAFVSYTPGGASTANLTGTTLTGWVYDDAANRLYAPGTVQGRFNVTPSNTLDTVILTGGVSLSTNGGAATAGSFSCTEGTFGGPVGASICGNYNFGANFYNESTTSWGPGTSVSRTLGGDDQAVFFIPPGIPSGQPQNLHDLYDGMTLAGFAGGTLIIGNTNNNTLLVTTCPINNDCPTRGYSFKVTGLVPVPAAAWLFPSALGLLGLRRKRTA